MWLPTLGFVALSTVVGLWSDPIYSICQTAAAQLIEPSLYITAVLGLAP